MKDQVIFRRAGMGDLPVLVGMLADDELGRKRENFTDPLPDSYTAAFEEIEQDGNNELVVAERDGRICGMIQLTFTPCLTYQGGWRCTVEGVRTASSERGKGLGTQMFEWAIARAKERGCHVIQLTTDNQRPDARRFYEKLGFKASHVGMKLHF
ncbi:GNAT family N-acetyltransferase [Alteribacter natronophilus]|uniref:GNAT family N-acetyltransferase n=1 Tax=Alteribacter natronophilus TaxID=2583810 RepID=UPI00110E25F8|nr:GNAT family N-acetyltransferase [Alteribacter natronophilus]TMW72756.1 GNAT family N-acetyltransferase [Alteribacter natronophilus]